MEPKSYQSVISGIQKSNHYLVKINDEKESPVEFMRDLGKLQGRLVTEIGKIEENLDNFDDNQGRGLLESLNSTHAAIKLFNDPKGPFLGKLLKAAGETKLRGGVYTQGMKQIEKDLGSLIKTLSEKHPREYAWEGRPSRFQRPSTPPPARPSRPPPPRRAAPRPPEEAVEQRQSSRPGRPLPPPGAARPTRAVPQSSVNKSKGADEEIRQGGQTVAERRNALKNLEMRRPPSQ